MRLTTEEKLELVRRLLLPILAISVLTCTSVLLRLGWGVRVVQPPPESVTPRFVVYDKRATFTTVDHETGKIQGIYWERELIPLTTVDGTGRILGHSPYGPPENPLIITEEDLEQARRQYARLIGAAWTW